MMHNNSSSGHLQRRGWLARLKGFAGSPPGMLIVTIAIIGLFSLAFADLDQVVPILPLGVLLLCPLMHVFMHRSHGGDGNESRHRHG